MRPHLLPGDKVNHLTNHPRRSQKDRHDVLNDQRWIREYFQRFLADEFEAKGLNYATTHYLNGGLADPVKKILGEQILSHTFKENDLNFLLEHFEATQVRSRLPDEEDQDWLHQPTNLNRQAKLRVAERAAQEKAQETEEREELRRQLFNMFFKMKEIVQNLNDSDPNDPEPAKKREEAQLRIVEALRRYLLPKPRKGAPKDEPSQAKAKVKAVRDYMGLRSDELKEVIYEDVFFEENMTKNKNDVVMKKLTERLEPHNYEKLKQIGGQKAKQFMRLIMTRQLMMKEERDRVVLKRLQQKKLEEKEEEELMRIMNNYQKKEDKKFHKVHPAHQVAVVPKLPAGNSGLTGRELSALLNQTVSSFNEGSLTLREGRKAGTTVLSSALTLDAYSRQPTKPVQRTEKLTRFDGDKKFAVQPTALKVAEQPSEESRGAVQRAGNRSSGKKPRFKKRSVTDTRNELLREHEENLRRAKAVLVFGGKEAVAM